MKIICNHNLVTIEGLVDSTKSSEEIKQQIKAVAKETQSLVIDFKDSFAVTSSLIGYFLGLIQKDKKKIKIIARNQDLFELFEELELIAVFGVTRS